MSNFIIGQVGQHHDDMEKGAEEWRRGFMTPEGRFLNRAQASVWLKQNNPEAYAKLSDKAKRQLHTEDLNKTIEPKEFSKFRKLKLSEMKEQIDAMPEDEREQYQRIYDQKKGK
jgi:hypothetical protein